MAVMKASRGVTRPRRPHSEAMVSSAFRMFSVAVSSVLKEARWKREGHYTACLLEHSFIVAIKADFIHFFPIMRANYFKNKIMYSVFRLHLKCVFLFPFSMVENTYFVPWYLLYSPKPLLEGRKQVYLASSSRDRAASRPHQQALTISSHTRWAPVAQTQTTGYCFQRMILLDFRWYHNNKEQVSDNMPFEKGSGLGYKLLNLIGPYNGHKRSLKRYNPEF